MLDDPINQAIAYHGEVDPKGCRAVQQMMNDQTVRSAVYYQETDSTNTAAIGQIQESGVVRERLPLLILADMQSAGRGRRGRRWSSDAGTLTFSLVITDQDPQRQSLLAKYCSLAVGVGIARYLEYEFAPLKVKLKWPNDVYLAGGKLAGILIEVPSGKADCLVIGVGVNVGTQPVLDDKERIQSVTCLSHVLGRSMHRYDLLPGLVNSILASVANVSGMPRDLLTDFTDRCVLTGQQIEYQNNGVRTSGTCLGISDNGALRVLSSAGELEISTGEANLLRLHS